MYSLLRHLHRPFIYRLCRHLPVVSIHTSTISLCSVQKPYRNRYTHHKNAYPGKPMYWYGAYTGILMVIFIFLLLGGGYYLDNLEVEFINDRQKKRKQEKCVKAACQSFTTSTSTNNNTAGLDESSREVKKQGFRERRFIAYEDRIRAYSTPDKIFRYFATLRCTDEDGDTIYMTPDDFLRSITPGMKQPDGLDLDSFKRYDPKRNIVLYRNKTEELKLDIAKDSIFYQMCDNALISFSDFVFLLTVLSTPRKQFEIAFKIFDLNGDGVVDANEFNVVRSVILDITAMGRRHRDHTTTGGTLKRNTNSALQHYFFGPEGDRKLSITQFLDFHARLQEEITRLEFDRAKPKDGKLTEVQFARYLLTYAGFSQQRRRKLMRNVKQKFSGLESSEGITYQDFSDFNVFLRSIGDINTALTFHHMAGASIDQETLAFVASTVAKVNLSPHVIDVVFTLFDENNDGHLSQREFIGVMHNRLLRGLDKPMDTGFVRFINALFVCAKEQWHSRFISQA